MKLDFSMTFEIRNWSRYATCQQQNNEIEIQPNLIKRPPIPIKPERPTFIWLPAAKILEKLSAIHNNYSMSPSWI